MCVRVGRACMWGTCAVWSAMSAGGGRCRRGSSQGSSRAAGGSAQPLGGAKGDRLVVADLKGFVRVGGVGMFRSEALEERPLALRGRHARQPRQAAPVDGGVRAVGERERALLFELRVQEQCGGAVGHVEARTKAIATAKDSAELSAACYGLATNPVLSVPTLSLSSCTVIECWDDCCRRSNPFLSGGESRRPTLLSASASSRFEMSLAPGDSTLLLT